MQSTVLIESYEVRRIGLQQEQYRSENGFLCTRTVVITGWNWNFCSGHGDVVVGSRPSDHYFRSVCWFVCLFVCAEFFSAVFDPILIKLGHMLYVWV